MSTPTTKLPGGITVRKAGRGVRPGYRCHCWTVIGWQFRVRGGAYSVVCRCDCGTVMAKDVTAIGTNNTSSCGCHFEKVRANKSPDDPNFDASPEHIARCKAEMQQGWSDAEFEARARLCCPGKTAIRLAAREIEEEYRYDFPVLSEKSLEV